MTDLLPHLASEQNGRKLAEGLKGEELNIIIGSIPYHDEENEKIKNPAKLLAMKLLNERYGITEKDFTRAEIEMVPAYKAVDIGLDRGLVGAYGQDDRVCALHSSDGGGSGQRIRNTRHLRSLRTKRRSVLSGIRDFTRTMSIMRSRTSRRASGRTQRLCCAIPSAFLPM